MNALTRYSSMTLGALIGVFGAQAPTQAGVGPDPNDNGRHSRIVGLWDVTATITRCDNGATLFSFPAMHKYELGGTGQVVPATDPGALSAHMLAWSYAGDDQYQWVMKMFRFDGVGAYIGWVEVTSDVSIDADGFELEGAGIARFYDTAGNVVAASCPVLTGTRFNGDF